MKLYSSEGVAKGKAMTLLKQKMEEEVKAKSKVRPMNMLVYLLILLSHGDRNPLILRVLITACSYKKSTFSQNHQQLVEFFAGKESLVAFLLTELKIEKFDLAFTHKEE